ncbi:MAG: leucine-rich repeat domain-containing protein [Muribaculaceae bacterium]|nr:leucine-rich repeat domain-containing protein [Muribaculaceae bacterium]
MKKLLQIMALLLCTALYSCSSDEPKNPDNPGGSTSTNNSSVTIKADGSTSTGVVFSPIDETTFFLDYIKYKIVDSHLEIVGYDPIEISEHVKPYATVTYQGVTYQTRVVSEYAFYNCKRMTSCELPATVVRITDYDYIGETVKTAGVFENCTNLQSISRPNSLEYIGSRAFQRCSSLTSVTFPDGLKYIGSRAFEDCTGLTSVTFPGGLQSIRGEAFSGCTGLKSITCLAVNPPECSGWGFEDETFENASLKVPSSSIELYKETDPWNNFKNIQGL